MPRIRPGTAARYQFSFTAARAARVNSAEASIACCVAGLGLLQIPRYDVQAELQSGALMEVMPQYVAQSLPVTLLQPHRQHRAQRVQVFIEWLLPVLMTGLQLQ